MSQLQGSVTSSAPCVPFADALSAADPYGRTLRGGHRQSVPLLSSAPASALPAAPVPITAPAAPRSPGAVLARSPRTPRGSSASSPSPPPPAGRGSAVPGLGHILMAPRPQLLSWTLTLAPGLGLAFASGPPPGTEEWGCCGGGWRAREAHRGGVVDPLG